jgi:hypothetical protein
LSTPVTTTIDCTWYGILFYQWTPPPTGQVGRGTAGTNPATPHPACLDGRGLGPPGETKLTLEAAAPLAAQPTVAVGRGSPPTHRPHTQDIGLARFVFVSCLSHANRIQGRMNACLNHSSLFKVNVKSIPSPSLIGRGGVSGGLSEESRRGGGDSIGVCPSPESLVSQAKGHPEGKGGRTPPPPQGTRGPPNPQGL